MSIDRTPQELLLKNLTQSFVPLLDARYNIESYCHLDLSINNKELSTVDVGCSAELGRYVNSKLLEQGSKIGYGGYNERRDIYSRSVYFNKDNSDNQRNIHLGIDLWCGAGTPVLAAYPGKVHSFKDNKNHGDYGPCIILQHEVKGVNFYTLYGHLSRKSLNTIKVGQQFSAGDIIAHLGESMENGDYAPHLHFQIIMDMENYSGDYPGVSSAQNVRHFLTNCPDPNLLIKIY
ncbi:peptidoglycan DD-metalloendopeptidase family protein [Flavimarina sp. Hel_I_48]|uniref:peptidoglycan DD-metalloendopeptidase family protein n=1 Tax=Flavimarina sp. Hel_I_48 TaxID=1392488 RepID=UPI00068BC832|nr:peptidoglycan DD-metalloendopeptidase family protein [Flavimarina sp. Hel_I_48]